MVLCARKQSFYMLFSKLYRHIDMSRSNFLYQEALSLPGTPRNLDTVEQEERDSARRIRAWQDNDTGSTRLRKTAWSGRPRTTHNLDQPTAEVTREEQDSARRIRSWSNNDSGNTQLSRLDGSGRPRTTHNLDQPTPEVVREENDTAKRMNAVNNYGETPSKKTAEQHVSQYSPRVPRYTQPNTLWAGNTIKAESRAEQAERHQKISTEADTRFQANYQRGITETVARQNRERKIATSSIIGVNESIPQRQTTDRLRDSNGRFQNSPTEIRWRAVTRPTTQADGFNIAEIVNTHPQLWPDRKTPVPRKSGISSIEYAPWVKKPSPRSVNQ